MPATTHRHLRALLAAAACLLALAAVLVAAPARALADGTVQVGDPAAPTSSLSYLAQIVYDGPLRAGPSESAAVTGAVSTKTHWGGQTQLLVLGSARTGGDLWLNVRVDGRPNGHNGWISGALAQVTTTGYRIEVSRASKSLRLFNGGRQIKSIKVVVGAPGTPTPAGSFAIADKLQVTDTNNFLGSWVLPLTAYSDILRTFDGGQGQIALHGRGGASLKVPVGKAASHGCVRIENTNINRIAALVPTGTPVNIS
ncbi:MAG: L,D-transpeptidase [Patulibacter sp.]|nr:L,D-transpeptidase [Patulibacter sp.]